MRSKCIIMVFAISIFANYKAIAGNEIQAMPDASEILRAHFWSVFESQSINLDTRNPQDENVGISLVDVDEMDEVTIRYKGEILKARGHCVFPSLIQNGFLVVSYAGRDRGKNFASLELYIPKKSLHQRYHMQQLINILLGDRSSVKKEANKDPDSEDIGTDLHKTLDEFKKIRTTLEFPEHLMQKDGKKRGDEFDVEKYFTVLKHISMKKGYRLDYVYHLAGIGGSPILYSRKIDQPPYANHEEYTKAIRKEAHLDEVELIEKEFDKKTGTENISAAMEWREKQLERYPNYRHWDWYLDDICTDGTAQGWLELIILHLLGDQFYLFWHAGYNDAMIIPDYSALSDVTNQSVFGEEKVSPIIPLLGSTLDVRPRVEVQDKIVTVSIVTFSKWGGFKEQVFSVNKDSPHRIKEISDNTLILYNCNVVF